MAHTTSARKRVRQAATRRTRNKPKRSSLRTQLKKTAALIEAKSPEAATAEFLKASRLLDRAARKGLIHKNQAARRKSRLAKKLTALGKPPTT
jgi:small subunit ribosomal protein S20